MDKKLIDVVVPHEHLKQGRMQALQNYRRHKKLEKLKITTITITLSIAALFFAIITVSNFSPTVSNYMGKIPGLSSIFSIEDDKDLRDIVDNENFQEIGTAIQVNGIEVHLVGVIADEKNMVIAFTATSNNGKKLRPTFFNVLQNGEQLNASMSYDGWDYSKHDFIQDMIVIENESPINYHDQSFEFVLGFQNDMMAETKVKIPFTVDEPIIKTKIIELNQSMLFENQRILVKSVEVSPIRTKITFAADEQNTMQILQLGHIELIDEKGEIWGSIQNGITAIGSPRDAEFSYFIQSNYFRNPKSLTLKVGAVEALEKGNDVFSIDVDQQRILNAEHLDAWDISINDHELLIKQHGDSIRTRDMISKFVDQLGQDVYSESSVFHAIEGEGNESRMSLPRDEQIQQPLTAMIDSYPNYIGTEQFIQIPIQK